MVLFLAFLKRSQVVVSFFLPPPFLSFPFFFSDSHFLNTFLFNEKEEGEGKEEGKDVVSHPVWCSFFLF